MYLCYVDESGFTGKKYNKEQPIQVICGILVNLYCFHKSDSNFKKIFSIIKQKIPLKEIKGSEIYRGRGSWKKVSADTRDKLIEFYLNWLVDRNHKVILSIVDNERFFKIKSDKNNKYTKYINKLPYPWLVSAFHIALVIQLLNKKQKKNKGKTLLIFDEEDTFEEQLRELIFNPPNFSDEFVPFNRKNERYRLNQIIDTAYFVKSHHSTLAQVSDIVAFLFKTYTELQYKYKTESYNGETKKIEKWIDKIKNKFIRFSSVYPIKGTLFIEFLKEIKPDNIRW